MKKQASDLSENELEVLRIFADPERTQAPDERIGKLLGVSQQRVNTIINQLEEKGLLEVDREPKIINIKRLTRRGYQEATCGGKVVCLNKDEEDQVEIRLHKFIVRFEIENPEELSDAWVERYLTAKPVSYKWNPEDGNYWVFSDNFNYRITENHVYVHLKEIRGHDANVLKDRAFLEVFDARDWLENNSPINLTSHSQNLDVQVREQHMALVNDPFAELVQSSEMGLEEIKIRDEDGKVRLKMDQSTGVPELESEDLVHGEEDIQAIKEFYDWAIRGDEERNLKDVVRGLKQDASRGSIKTELAQELDGFTSKWVDNHGNLMGWSSQLEKAVKIIPKEEI
jgi:biotin operon repressor